MKTFFKIVAVLIVVMIVGSFAYQISLMILGVFVFWVIKEWIKENPSSFNKKDY